MTPQSIWDEEMCQKSEEQLLWDMGVTKPKYVIGVPYPIEEIDDKDKNKGKDRRAIY